MQPPEHLLRDEEHRPHVDVGQLVIGIDIHLLDGHEGRDAGVVHQHVDVRFGNAGGQTHRAIAGGEIGLHQRRAAAISFDGGAHDVRFCLAAAVVQDDVKAVARKALRDGGTDSARGAGDERHLAG